MKTRILAIAFFSAIFLMGCSSDEDSHVAQSFRVTNYSHTGCKSYASTNSSRAQKDDGSSFPSFIEYIEYEGHDNGYITLKHIDAMFNCAVAEIEASVSLSGNQIIIDEHEVLGEVAANCICPYDLSFDAGPLTDGNYTVIVRRDGYISGKATIDFSKTAKGRVILEEDK